MITGSQQIDLASILTRAHRNYEKDLRMRVYSKLNDRVLGEDLVQTAFMKAWIYLMRGGKINIMKAFLHHVLNNLIVDEYRKRKNVSLDFLIEKGFEPTIDESEHMFAGFDGKKAVTMIKRLPSKYQKVMKMRYVKDMSLKEMSVITGQSKNTLAVQAYRGLRMLKDLREQAY
jgi:RNA polymerase sigma-70 factor (ECF subfamily)